MPEANWPKIMLFRRSFDAMELSTRVLTLIVARQFFANCYDGAVVDADLPADQPV
jgi:hypothetical protein